MTVKKLKKQPPKKPDKPKAVKPKKKTTARKPAKNPKPKKPDTSQPKPDPVKGATAEHVEKLEQAGQLAKYKLYQSFIARISKGETLKATELKVYNQLSTELFDDEKGDKDEIIAGEMEAVAYLGISKRMLSYHKGKGNIKQNADGTFSKAVLDEFLAGRGGSDSLDVELKKAKLRVTVARARLNEIMVKQARGELISKKDVEAKWAVRVVATCAGLETHSDRLPPLLEGKTRQQMKEIIDIEVWRLRESFAREGRYCPKQTVVGGDK